MSRPSMKSYRVSHTADFNFYHARVSDQFEAQSDWQAHEIARRLSESLFYDLEEYRVVPRLEELEKSDLVATS